MTITIVEYDQFYRSTAEGIGTFSYYSYSIHTMVESIRVLEFRSSLKPYIIFSLSMLPHFPAPSYFFNLVLYFENDLRIVANSCTIVLFINTVHAGALKPSSTRVQ